MKRIAVSLALLLLLLVAIVAAYLATVDLNDFQDPLLNAARDGDIAAITKLIEHGMDPNRSDAYGNTPLSVAAHFGRVAAG